MIVSEELKETIRSHHDVDKDDIPYMRKAAKVCGLCCSMCACIYICIYLNISPNTHIVAHPPSRSKYSHYNPAPLAALHGAGQAGGHQRSHSGPILVRAGPDRAGRDEGAVQLHGCVGNKLSMFWGASKRVLEYMWKMGFCIMIITSIHKYDHF